MQELAQETKKMISKDRLSIYDLDIPPMSLSKISEAVSISNEKGLEPYWTESCKKRSQRLLLHTKTDCVDLGLNLSNTLQINTTAKSWFSATASSLLRENSFKTSLQSYMFSPVAFTDSENTVNRSKKIRIYPKDRKRANQYFGLSRYWYNQAIEYLKQEGTKASLGEVRQIQKIDHPEWAFDCPQRIREHAMSDAVKAVKNAKKKYKKTKQAQQVGFKSKKNPKQSFGFDQKSLKELFVFKNKKYQWGFYATEQFSPSLEGTRVIKENDRYFLIIPEKRVIKKPENQRIGIVSIDPGVRTFATFFNPIVCGKIGDSDFGRIQRLCYHMDKLISRVIKAKAPQKRRMRKALKRMRWKIKDLIADLHHKIAYFLVTRFDYILLPTFETGDMTNRSKRNIDSKTARSMLTFAHYRFKKILHDKAIEYSAHVFDVCEAYTSKTCSFCGKIKEIGKQKVYKCSCGINVNRDLNGARGIFLRALLASTWESC